MSPVGGVFALPARQPAQPPAPVAVDRHSAFVTVRVRVRALPRRARAEPASRWSSLRSVPRLWAGLSAPASPSSSGPATRRRSARARARARARVGARLAAPPTQARRAQESAALGHVVIPAAPQAEPAVYNVTFEGVTPNTPYWCGPRVAVHRPDTSPSSAGAVGRSTRTTHTTSTASCRRRWRSTRAVSPTRRSRRRWCVPLGGRCSLRRRLLSGCGGSPGRAKFLGADAGGRGAGRKRRHHRPLRAARLLGHEPGSAGLRVQTRLLFLCLPDGGGGRACQQLQLLCHRASQ